jgi:hypothetical protein
MLISAVVAPFDAQQVHFPPPPPGAPLLDRIDEQIIAALRAHGRYGAGIWELLNPLASAQEHNSRADLRAARLALWDRLRGLLKRGLVFRQGRKRISLVKLPQASARRRRRRRAGITISSMLDQNPAGRDNQLRILCLDKEGALPTTSLAPQKTKTAEAHARTPVIDRRREDIRRAAIALAKMPRGGKGPLTGYLHGRPARRGQPILLPGGRRAFVWGCKRGKVVWSMDPKELLSGVLNAGVAWGALPQAQVTLEMNAAAAVLGQGKRGVREAPSALKATSCRANGRCPVRARRKRGRPRHLAINKSKQVDDARR